VKKGAPLQYVLIIHEVADYPGWKQVFDDAADIRCEAGERSYQVLRYEQDANRIVHFSAWTSIADAKTFFESPRLGRIRQEAGVKAPEFIYLELLEAGTLQAKPAGERSRLPSR
jgi:quinol monooxygenase YgiN